MAIEGRIVTQHGLCMARHGYAWPQYGAVDANVTHEAIALLETD
jgi:hypothetical protein